ncbi:MAG: carbon-nitrogen hydrolase family protein [Calditrichaeota bacterium]|nr:MAG: carbon-nitrogen hydrolase family protein [Calditrichota bacterium]
MSFKIALIQMHIVGGNKRQNLNHVEDLIAQAVDHGAELILLPELMDLGWTHPSCLTEAEPIPDGEPAARLIHVAGRHKVFICAGLSERDGNAVYNSAIIIHPDGRVLTKHRKLNELVIGHPYYGQGNRLGVVSTELGDLGLMICADGFAKDSVISRALGYMGADVILCPSAWAVAADHDNLKSPYGDLWRKAFIPVAKEFSMWIIAVSNVGAMTAGPWAGRKCIGSSLVIGPTGEEIVQGPYGCEAETILYVDIKPTKRPARGDGWSTYWNEQSTV